MFRNWRADLPGTAKRSEDGWPLTLSLNHGTRTAQNHRSEKLGRGHAALGAAVVLIWALGCGRDAPGLEDAVGTWKGSVFVEQGEDRSSQKAELMIDSIGPDTLRGELRIKYPNYNRQETNKLYGLQSRNDSLIGFSAGSIHIKVSRHTPDSMAAQGRAREKGKLFTYHFELRKAGWAQQRSGHFD